MTPIQIFKNGIAKAKIKDYEGALLDFNIVIQLDPEGNANYYNNKGSALSYLGRKKEAMAEFDKAIQLDPNNSHFYFNRAENLAYFCNYKRAIADYKKCLSISPNDHEARYQMKLAEFYRDLERNNTQNKEPIEKKIKLFISYSHKDEELKEQFDNHLSTLKRMGFIEVWNDREITASDEWEQEIDENLNDADIIACLISSDFISSDYCFSKEMELAIEKHDNHEAKVLPIIVRPVVWNILPIGEIQALPKDGKAVTSWSNIDEAFQNITEGILKLINEIKNDLSREI